MSGDGIATVQAAALSPTMRKRLTSAASRFFPELGVTVTPRNDGTVDITLPAMIAEAFILNLTFWAQETREALQKARIQEAERQAQLLAESGETQRTLEAQEDDWAREYERLRTEGLGHRDALHRIHDGLAEKPGVEAVEHGISRGRARLQRRGELPARHYGTRAQVAARRREIARLAQEEGLSRREIADCLNVSYALVQRVLKRAGVPISDRRRRAGRGD